MPEKRVGSLQTGFDRSNTELPLMRSHYEKIGFDLIYIARHFPMESVAAQWAYLMNYEKHWKIELTERAEAIRTVFSEIEKIVWYHDYFFHLYSALGEDELAIEWNYMRDGFLEYREYAFGARVFPNLLALGGVSKDFLPGAKKRLYSHLHTTQKQLELLHERGLEVLVTLKARYLVDRDVLDRLSWGGPVAQASGSQWDARFFAPYGLYKTWENIRPTLSVSRQTPTGDAFERAHRVFTALTSTSLTLRKILEDMPLKGTLVSSWKSKHEMPITYSTSVTESASGPVYVTVYKGKFDVSTSRSRALPQFSSILKNSDNSKVLSSSMGLSYAKGVR